MIGSTVRSRSGRAAMKRVRVTTSAKARPRPVVDAAVRSASRSVFHATPHVPPPVRQSSRQIFAVKRRATRGARRQRAAVGLDRGREDAHDREEGEEADERRDEHHRAGDEAVAPEGPARGEPGCAQEQEGGADDEGAHPQPDLPVVERAEHAPEDGPGPAGEADGEALSEGVEEAGGAERREPSTEGSPVAADEPGGERGHEDDARQRQPGTAEAGRLERRGSGVAVRHEPGDPAPGEEAVGDRVPRQQEEAGAADQAPGDRAPGEGRGHPTSAGSPPLFPSARSGACAPPSSRTWRSRSRSA